MQNAPTPLAMKLMEEVREAGDDFSRILDKLKKCEPGSERYYDLLCADLFVAAEVVRMKAAHAKQEADRLMNQLDRLERQQNAQKRKKNHPAVRHTRSRHASDLARRRAS